MCTVILAVGICVGFCYLFVPVIVRIDSEFKKENRCLSLVLFSRFRIFGIGCLLSKGQRLYRIIFFGKEVKIRHPFLTKRKTMKRTESQKNWGKVKIDTQYLLRYIFRYGGALLTRLMQCFQILRMETDVVVGLGDPCRTGQLYGVIQVIRSLFSKKIDICVQLDFLNEKLEGQFSAEVQIAFFRLTSMVVCESIRYYRIHHQRNGIRRKPFVRFAFNKG